MSIFVIGNQASCLSLWYFYQVDILYFIPQSPSSCPIFNIGGILVTNQQIDFQNFTSIYSINNQLWRLLSWPALSDHCLQLQITGIDFLIKAWVRSLSVLVKKKKKGWKKKSFSNQISVIKWKRKICWIFKLFLWIRTSRTWREMLFSVPSASWK